MSIGQINFNKSSKILDIACGIGRWADAIPDEVFEYCGIDFSDELVEIAKKDEFLFDEDALDK